MAVDMYETDDSVVVKTAIPGVKGEEINISVARDALSVKAESKAEEESGARATCATRDGTEPFSGLWPCPAD